MDESCLGRGEASYAAQSTVVRIPQEQPGEEVHVPDVADRCAGAGRVTVSYRLEPKQNRAVLLKERPKPSPRQPRFSDRTARMLALAHHVEIFVEDGRLPDYAAAARILGVTRARMTQVLNLLLLAPEIQERVLLGTLEVRERRLRAALCSMEWVVQQQELGTPVADPRNRTFMRGR